MEYSLADLREMENKRYFFTKDRFFRYFTILGKSEEVIEKYFRLWNKFPNYTDDELEIAYFFIKKILAYPEKKRLPGSYRFSYKYKKNKKRIYYKNSDNIVSFEIDLNEEDDIILYADFLKGKPEVIAVVDFIEELSIRGNKVKVFDGDVFSTSETWERRRDGEVFMCHGGPYKRLLYTQGKGYVRNGDPDLDDPCYSSHVLIMKDKIQFIGNIYADASFLVDPTEGEDDDVE